MKKFVCQICGYVHEGDSAPEKCPVCGAAAEKFTEQAGEMTWAAEHVVGVASGVDEEILEGLRMNFTGECTEVGMYLAMARVAHREASLRKEAIETKVTWHHQNQTLPP